MANWDIPLRIAPFGPDNRVTAVVLSRLFNLLGSPLNPSGTVDGVLKNFTPFTPDVNTPAGDKVVAAGGATAAIQALKVSKGGSLPARTQEGWLLTSFKTEMSVLEKWYAKSTFQVFGKYLGVDEETLEDWVFPISCFDTGMEGGDRYVYGQIELVGLRTANGVPKNYYILRGYKINYDGARYLPDPVWSLENEVLRLTHGPIAEDFPQFVVTINEEETQAEARYTANIFAPVDGPTNQAWEFRLFASSFFPAVINFRKEGGQWVAINPAGVNSSSGYTVSGTWGWNLATPVYLAQFVEQHNTPIEAEFDGSVENGGGTSGEIPNFGCGSKTTTVTQTGQYSAVDSPVLQITQTWGVYPVFGAEYVLRAATFGDLFSESTESGCRSNGFDRFVDYSQLYSVSLDSEDSHQVTVRFNKGAYDVTSGISPLIEFVGSLSHHVFNSDAWVGGGSPISDFWSGSTTATGTINCENHKIVQTDPYGIDRVIGYLKQPNGATLTRTESINGPTAPGELFRYFGHRLVEPVQPYELFSGPAVYVSPLGNEVKILPQIALPPYVAMGISEVATEAPIDAGGGIFVFNQISPVIYCNDVLVYGIEYASGAGVFAFTSDIRIVNGIQRWGPLGEEEFAQYGLTSGNSATTGSGTGTGLSGDIQAVNEEMEDVRRYLDYVGHDASERVFTLPEYFSMPGSDEAPAFCAVTWPHSDFFGAFVGIIHWVRSDVRDALFENDAQRVATLNACLYTVSATPESYTIPWDEEDLSAGYFLFNLPFPGKEALENAISAAIVKVQDSEATEKEKVAAINNAVYTCVHPIVNNFLPKNIYGLLPPDSNWITNYIPGGA